jgi:DNA modification methylase
LRDYGTAAWEGGDSACNHAAPIEGGVSSNKGNSVTHPWRFVNCKCGARRIDRQIGLEATPEEYVATMVDLFREVRRVLRADGTVWLNLGDSYAGSTMTGGNKGFNAKGGVTGYMQMRQFNRKVTLHGLKPKDLCGIPWRVAFALQADGWTLRQEIIWKKSNPMPESINDRCTKAHEQLFLFAKAKWAGPDNGRFSGISDQDARWLAALIDAEGCIVVKRCQHSGRSDTFAPQVSLGGTSLAFISEFARLAGYGNVLERSGKNAPMFYWQVANNVARDFLHRIYPWLIVKQRQARIGIFVDDLTYYRGGKKPERKRRSKEEHDQLLSLWDRNKHCNRFGNPDLSDVPEPIYGKWANCERYFYDIDAIREPAQDRVFDPAFKTIRPNDTAWHDNRYAPGASGYGHSVNVRNKRSVWTIATALFAEAHFATFPPALVEPCIKAGTSEKGCCAKCGAPWVRKTKATFVPQMESLENIRGAGNQKPMDASNNWGGFPRGTTVRETLGWSPSCKCDGAVVPCTVLDCFGGAGTTGLVADRLQRDAILIELNESYAAMAERRIAGDSPLFSQVAAE